MARQDGTTRQIMTALKRKLMERGVTFQEVANAMGVSEATVKQWSSSGRISIQQLVSLLDWLGLSLAELAQEAGVPRAEYMTHMQEMELAQDLRLMHVYVLATLHWQPSDILKHFDIDEAECHALLHKLERIGLIDLTSENRIRLRSKHDFRWLPGGPIRELFSKGLGRKYIGLDFMGDNDHFWAKQVLLTESGIARVKKMVKRLEQTILELNKEFLDSAEEGQLYSLLFAHRDANPPLFKPIPRRMAENRE